LARAIRPATVPTGTPEPPCGLGVGQPLEEAQEDEHPVRLRQAGDFLVENAFGIGVRRYRGRSGQDIEVAGRNRGHHPPPAGAGRDPAGHSEHPTCGRTGTPDGGGLSSQGQEHGLSGVLGRVAVAENTQADAQDQSGVAPDEQLERPGVPVGNESLEQFGVGRFGEGGENACGRVCHRPLLPIQ
jgi:hypothetical protein